MDLKLMEHNLANMIQQMNRPIEDGNDSPVDPFRKRVFEKRLRSSSVASDAYNSENINPNMSKMRLSNFCRPVTETANNYPSIKKSNSDIYSLQIQRMFNATFRSLEEAKTEAMTRVRELCEQQERNKQLFSSSYSCEEEDNEQKKFVKNLKETLSFIGQYLSHNSHSGYNEENSSVNCMQNYELTYQTEKSHGNNQENIIAEKEENLIESKVTHAGEGKKAKGEKKEKSTPKSVYESILEERRMKNKTRRSRNKMI